MSDDRPTTRWSYEDQPRRTTLNADGELVNDDTGEVIGVTGADGVCRDVRTGYPLFSITDAAT